MKVLKDYKQEAKYNVELTESQMKLVFLALGNSSKPRREKLAESHFEDYVEERGNSVDLDLYRIFGMALDSKFFYEYSDEEHESIKVDKVEGKRDLDVRLSDEELAVLTSALGLIEPSKLEDKHEMVTGKPYKSNGYELYKHLEDTLLSE